MKGSVVVHKPLTAPGGVVTIGGRGARAAVAGRPAANPTTATDTIIRMRVNGVFMTSAEISDPGSHGNRKIQNPLKHFRRNQEP